jgi:hypothetical protein
MHLESARRRFELLILNTRVSSSSSSMSQGLIGPPEYVLRRCRTHLHIPCLGNALKLTGGSHRIGCVLQNVGGNRVYEGAVPERQGLRVGDDERTIKNKGLLAGAFEVIDDVLLHDLSREAEPCDGVLP